MVLPPLKCTCIPYLQTLSKLTESSSVRHYCEYIVAFVVVSYDVAIDVFGGVVSFVVVFFKLVNSSISKIGSLKGPCYMFLL